MRRHPVLWLVVIVAVAIIAAVFVYPKGWGATTRPWQLGLDLQGGAHLILQVQVSEAVNEETDNTVQEIQQDLKKANLSN